MSLSALKQNLKFVIYTISKKHTAKTMDSRMFGKNIHKHTEIHLLRCRSLAISFCSMAKSSETGKHKLQISQRV